MPSLSRCLVGGASWPQVPLTVHLSVRLSTRVCWSVVEIREKMQQEEHERASSEMSLHRYEPLWLEKRKERGQRAIMFRDMKYERSLKVFDMATDESLKHQSKIGEARKTHRILDEVDENCTRRHIAVSRSGISAFWPFGLAISRDRLIHPSMLLKLSLIFQIFLLLMKLDQSGLAEALQSTNPPIGQVVEGE